jgi:hypothetical protein
MCGILPELALDGIPKARTEIVKKRSKKPGSQEKKRA